MISIDYTINIGNIIELAGLLVTGIYGFASLRNSVGVLKSDVSEMEIKIESKIEKVTELMTTVAVQTARLDMLSQRCNGLDERCARTERRFDEIQQGVNHDRANATR